MKNRKRTCILIGFLSLLLVGCAGNNTPQTTATTIDSKDAIEQSKTRQNKNSQIEFLIKEAKGFLAENKYEDAGFIAEYILADLDSTSQEAIKIQRDSYKELQKSLLGVQ